MDFWTRLKKEIRAKDTTQEWIAGKIGVPFGTFRKWMTRKTYPDIKEGVEIARLLETTVEFLVTGSKPGELNDEEQRLLSSYRKLGRADRENAVLTIDAWLGKGQYR